MKATTSRILSALFFFTAAALFFFLPRLAAAATSSSSSISNNTSSSSTSKQPKPPLYIQEYIDVDACSSSAKQNNMTIIDLGIVDSFSDCTRKATAWWRPTPRSSPGGRQQVQRCQTACWFRYSPDNSNGTNQDHHHCYCLPDVLWMPLLHVPEPEAQKVDTVRLIWPCENDQDCSYNGRCLEQSGMCDCYPSWTGPTCGELNLLPVEWSKLGYRAVDDQTGENISSWGAPILWDDDETGVDGQWHGWVSEITKHCGINAWQTNSQIVHIVAADSPLGPFTRREIVHDVFSHEPTVVRGPKGEWVMLFSSYRFNSTELANVECKNCVNGTTPTISPFLCPFQRGEPKDLRHKFRQMMSIAQSPNGPWSLPVEIPQLSKPWDWNTDLTINADGSAVALLRAGFVWHATNYSDPTTWAPVGNNNTDGTGQQGPPWKGVSVEDPFIWQNDGVYHALAHAFSPFYGVHAYVPIPNSSFDWDSGEPLDWTVTGVAYGNRVQFTDGRSHSFTRRERPHLVWAAGTKEGEFPIALSNGVQFFGVPNQPFTDGVFSLVQPLKRVPEMTDLQVS